MSAAEVLPPPATVATFRQDIETIVKNTCGAARETTSARAARGAASYLPGMTLREYVTLVRERHPLLAARLAFDRPGAESALHELGAIENEFETDGRAGRGESYRASQADPTMRMRGILTLLRLSLENAGEGAFLLDVLGGDGTIARATTTRSVRGGRAWTPITSDIAGGMIAAALHLGLPAIRQAAQFLFLVAGSVDAVLLAYGTHHIPAVDRPRAVGEAVRVLRPGGTLVVHDFDEHGPMARWFADVVDPFSAAGHRYAHFSRDGLRAYLDRRGLDDVRVVEVYDPFVVRAPTYREARERLADHLAAMYGLVGIYGEGRPTRAARDRVWELAEAIFVHDEREVVGGVVPAGLRVVQGAGSVVAELPRIALVGVARRAGAL